MAVIFAGYLANWLGKQVRVNRAGPDSFVGTLHSIQMDHLVVLAKEGTVYIKTAHIKSISEAEGGRATSGADVATAPTFVGLLHRLLGQSVVVNGGPERMEGTVADVNHETLTLEADQERIRIPIFHIKHVIVSRKRPGDQSGGGNGGKRSAGGGNTGRQGGSAGKRSGKRAKTGRRKGTIGNLGKRSGNLGKRRVSLGKRRASFGKRSGNRVKPCGSVGSGGKMGREGRIAGRPGGGKTGIMVPAGGTGKKSSRRGVAGGMRGLHGGARLGRNGARNLIGAGNRRRVGRKGGPAKAGACGTKAGRRANKR
jgi:spore coat protein B